MIDWIRFLKAEGFPVKYLSLHNQGDKPYGYPHNGSSTLGLRTDYNGDCPLAQVVEFIKRMGHMRKMKSAHDN